jgi:ribosome-associated heat shock protein Hsp15
MKPEIDKVRIDKWLWTVRFFKSRTLASDAVKGGRVKIKGAPIKSAYMVSRGEVIEVKKNGFTFQFKVVDLLKNRVSAPLAVVCYENITSEEELNKYNTWFTGKSRSEIREAGTGRPTKKERREIDEFKDDFLMGDDWFDEEEG